MSDNVAVIIPNLNSPLIDRVVAAVRGQKVAETGANVPIEVIVVGRDQPGLVPEAENVRFIDTEQPVLAAVARNRGVAATDADLLIFLDSDCLPTEEWLAAHLAAHEAGHQVVSGGIVPAGHNYWHLTYNLTLFHELLDTNPPGPRDFLATLNLSVERTVIERVGGMDETVNRVEDVEWTTRMRGAGFQPYFWPAASVWHDHSRTDFRRVWRDCASSGYHMRPVRLRHDDLLLGPSVLRYPRLVLALSPLVALGVTARIIWKRPAVIRRFWYTLPGLYLTKIAWCWGASRSEDPAQTL
ncbi:MAG TPA: glycosyltransferase [Candidatus Sulfomarinibacteraceae bacterium]|nr:glycosyltransferase [Candidatus Sulfomarinibacteraceae bacterium]